MDPGAPLTDQDRRWEHQLFVFLVIAFAIAASATLAGSASHSTVTAHLPPPPEAPPAIVLSKAADLSPGLVAVQVADVLLPDGTNNGVVLLVDEASRYVLPVFLPAAESEAIRKGLKPDGIQGAPDLLERTVTALGAEVERIEVHQGLHESVESRVVLRRDGQLMQLDARPADALALAVITHKPVYAPTVMLDAQGIRRDTITHLPGGLPSHLKDPEQL
jgi:bifunctional DNase/RNase